MLPYRLVTPVLLVVLCLCCFACLKSGTVDPNAVEILRSGAFDVESGEDIANSIYLDVQGQTDGLEALAAATEGSLRAGGYRIANNPSTAGHILHLNVLHNGKSEPERLRGAVTAGYGSPLTLGSGGATGLVVDALLVQRRVPQAQRPSHVRLKNISNRNAVGNSQMRFGLLLPFGVKKIPPAFAEVLSQEVAAAMRPRQALPPRQGDGPDPVK